MNLYLFLRSIVWTSILSVSSAIASLIVAFILPSPTPAIAFGLTALTLAILSPRKNEY
jgi:hypothetical protein